MSEDKEILSDGSSIESDLSEEELTELLISGSELKGEDIDNNKTEKELKDILRKEQEDLDIESKNGREDVIDKLASSLDSGTIDVNESLEGLSVAQLHQVKKSVNNNITSNPGLATDLTDALDNDLLLDVVKRNRPTSTILDQLMEEIAEEAAFLKAWRNLNWNSKFDLSESSLKRVRMLKSLVDTLVEKEKIKNQKSIGKVDFHSDSFNRVLKYFLEVILDTFNKVGIPAQYYDIFFTELAKAFDGFEKKAEKLYYGKDK